ncbi:g2581 [Coccomyxa elongata]
MNNLGNLGKKSGPTWSREFDLLIRSIGECKSKAEEDAIIAREVDLLKPRLKDAKIDKRSLKEVLVRLTYVEMLGHDASWGHVKALQACSDTNLLTKKVAYLASGLFLDYRSDLIILVVNTLTQDLKSDNYLVVCTALSAVGKLIGPDLINAVLPAVTGLTTHPKDLVRKKAVMALHRFQQLDPHHEGPLAGADLDKYYRQALCDKDPSVMSAALCALLEVVTVDPKPYKNLIPSFISILKQVAEHRLPKSYDYHRTPAPFIQIKLLKILSYLGAGDKTASDNMYAILGDILRRANTGHTIGNAIVAESVRTITAIYPNPALLQAAAEMVSGFLKSSSHNLRYVGIDSLARIVRINAKYATEHQLAVIDCLEDPDDTLKKKTLELLYKMTKPSNVEVIVEKLLDYLRTASDDGQKAEVAKRIGELAERFAPDTQWFIDTMNKVFEVGGDVVAVSLAHGLMRLIAEGAGEGDEAADAELRAQAATAYLQLLSKPKLPNILLKVICWVLGEYGTLAPGGAPAVLERLVDLAEGQALPDEVRGYLLTALAKLHAQAGLPLSPPAVQLLHDAASSHNVDLQLRALQTQALLEGPASTRQGALPADASCEDVDVDPSLPFLDGYVAAALANGAAPYISEQERFAMGVVRPSHHDEVAEHTHALRFTAYEKAAPPTQAPTQSREHSPLRGPQNGGLLGVDISSGAVAASSSAAASTEPQLALRGSGARKWGPAQFAPQAPVTAPSAAPTASATGGATALASTARAQEPEVLEVSKDKARLAASLFGDGSSPSHARAAGRRTPQKQAAPNNRGTASASNVPSLLEFDADAPSDPVTPAPSAAPPSQQDPFAALEGLSHPFDAAPAPAAPGIDLDALYGGVTAPQPRAAPLPGILDSLGAAVSSQQPPVDPFADPFAPPAQYQTTANLMGNLALGSGGASVPAPGSLLGGGQPPVASAAPMAARGNAAVEKKSAKKDPFADLLG